MELKNVEIKEGVIISAEDPEKLGRIKAVAPGEFDTSTMDEELLPWVYPMSMSCYNSFSRMIAGRKCWVIKNNSSHSEYYYIPYFEEIEITKNFLDEHYDDFPEVIFARDNCGTTACMTYDTKQGLILQVKDIYINITPDGDIICHSTNVDMSIIEGNVKLGGPDGPWDPMVMGVDLQKRLQALEGALRKLSSAASSALYPPPLAKPILDCADAIASGGYDSLLSDTCKVNKK